MSLIFTQLGSICRNRMRLNSNIFFKLERNVPTSHPSPVIGVVSICFSGWWLGIDLGVEVARS
jgi:hypothetical protein